ncbi:MAG: chemotaxis protein CheW [Deltaproteobacteria bacterium]|nr:chemotaxis protein CheW [Deltaproteobacteria bacterium]
MLEEKKTGELQLVTFNMGKEEFSVEILKVQEIIRMMEITRIPKSPDFVEGVINLRGKVIPIIDLRKRFGLPKIDKDTDTRIIVIESGGKSIGLIVDSVSEVLRLPASTVEPPPEIVGGIDSEYIEGVGKLEDRLIILLNLDKVLTSHEKHALSQMEPQPA